MAGILFVHGGDEHARTVYEREDRAYWARGFPVVLEKYGYLDFESAGPSALQERAVVDDYDLILVGRQAESIWTSDLIGHLATGRAQTLVDGPVPAAVRRALGITSAAPAPVEAVFRGTAADLTTLTLERFGVMSATRIGPPASTKDQPRSAAQDWRALPVPISERRARAWRVPTWDPEGWSVEAEAEIFAEWDVRTGTPTPAIVRRGSLLGCSFGLFEYLAQLHTSPPFDATEFLASPAPHGLEAYLVTLFDRLIADAGGFRVRVQPWPLGAEWALTVRHDFDRAIAPEQVEHVLAGHRRVRTAATWYWRASHFKRASGAPLASLKRDESRSRNKAALRLVAQDRSHEVALHTERPWPSGDRERRVVERQSGTRVRGSCAHGDPECFRFQGAPNILWAAAQKLDYTENIQHFHLHPYRFLDLGEDGLVRPLDVHCLPKHQSFDRSTLAGETYTEQVAASAVRYQQSGGLLQVMNHPDIHVEELFDLLRDLPSAQRVSWTAGEVISWWASTHHSGRLRVRAGRDGRVTVSASDEISQGALEVRAPDGTTKRQLLRAETVVLDPTGTAE